MPLEKNPKTHVFLKRVHNTSCCFVISLIYSPILKFGTVISCIIWCSIEMFLKINITDSFIWENIPSLGYVIYCVALQKILN